MPSAATEKSAGSAAQGQPVLSLRGVNKSFGAVHVLHGVDLDCYAGQVTALVGDNGAGKSTLIKGVAGIHPFDDGDLMWEGEEAHGTRAPPRARGGAPGPGRPRGARAARASTRSTTATCCGRARRFTSPGRGRRTR